MSNFEEQITFVTPHKHQIGVDGLSSLPAVGAGLYHEGTFWRVNDVWFNADHPTGPLPYGWIVKIDLAPDGDNPPVDFDAYYKE